MPIYEYQCLEKGHRFEALQKVGARPLKTCDVCGGKVRKLISATAFHLKGGGWYKDGYVNAGSGSPDAAKPSGVKTSESKKKGKE
jgi:putative FmdB family regulatory protein